MKKTSFICKRSGRALNSPRAKGQSGWAIQRKWKHIIELSENNQDFFKCTNVNCSSTDGSLDGISDCRRPHQPLHQLKFLD